MSSEASIEDAFVEYAEGRDCEAIKLRIDGQNGFPDRTILTPHGRVFFIEFKKPGGKLSVSQKRWIAKLKKIGFQCEVVDKLNDAKQILDDFLGG